MTLVLENIETTLGDRSFSFSLNAPAGQVHAILGKSGSGKSTLLNLIGGFIKPSRGSMTWNNESLLNRTPEERPVTTLFQAHNLFDHLTVRRNIALGVSPTMTLNTSDWDRIDQVLGDVGLEGRGDERPARLSGGEQQRVGLARCLLRRRPILLLDEPYGALDEATRLEMLSLTKDVIDSRDLCVLMVTHNPDDADHLNAIKYDLMDGSLSQRDQSK